MSIDIEGLLKEISPETPCGEDLAYDTDYMELERLAQGTPEQQVGDEVIAAEEPNWSDIRQRAEKLLSRSKDLRVALHLTLALLITQGLGGLRDGLALMRGLLETYWDGFYPPLDLEDEDPSLERINILASLSPSEDSYEDPMRFKQRVLEAPLSLPQDKRLARITLRDIMIASGELPLPASGQEPSADAATIDASFEATGTEELQAAAEAARAAGEHVKAIDAFLIERVGASKAPDLSAIGKAVQKVCQALDEYLARRGYGSDGGGEGGDDEKEGGAASGEIRSTKDIVQSLERICVYYERHEPSSPIPLLLRRAQRLVGKNFAEVIADLSPDAIKQVQLVSGVKGD